MNKIALEAKRDAVVHAVTNVYGAKRDYAEGLYANFGMVLFARKGSVEAKSPEGKLVKAEKTALYDALKAAHHSNPSKVWADVMTYAKQAAGIAPADKADNEPRSLTARNIEELLKLYKANAKDPDGDMDDTNVYIGHALETLGIDLADINKDL